MSFSASNLDGGDVSSLIPVAALTSSIVVAAPATFSHQVTGLNSTGQSTPSSSVESFVSNSRAFSCDSIEPSAESSSQNNSSSSDLRPANIDPMITRSKMGLFNKEFNILFLPMPGAKF